MATALDTTTAIQDKVYSALQMSQKAMLDGAKMWADTFETVMAKLPDLATAEPLKPTQLLTATLGFTEKVMTSQQEFTTKLLEVMMPVAKAATTAPKPKA